MAVPGGKPRRVAWPPAMLFRTNPMAKAKRPTPIAYFPARNGLARMERMAQAGLRRAVSSMLQKARHVLMRLFSRMQAERPARQAGGVGSADRGTAPCRRRA